MNVVDGEVWKPVTSWALRRLHVPDSEPTSNSSKDVGPLTSTLRLFPLYPAAVFIVERHHNTLLYPRNRVCLAVTIRFYFI